MSEGYDIVDAIPSPAEQCDERCPISWNTGLQVDELAPLDRLTIYTSNSRYDLDVICPAMGHVSIRGGTFLPSGTHVHVVGGYLGGECVKPRGIYVGLRLALLCEGQGIVTARVRAIEVHAAREPT